MIAKLGQDTDGHVARLLGVDPLAVMRARHAFGIPACKRMTIPAYQTDGWTPEMIAKLGQDTDVRVARELGVSWREVFSTRHALGIPKRADSKWSPEALAKLGKRSDAWVAKEFGLTRQAVHKKRKRLSIPPRSRAE